MNTTKKICPLSLYRKLLYVNLFSFPFFLIVSLLLSAQIASAQSNWQISQYNAYLKNDARLWHQSMKEVQATNDNFTIGYAGYGLLNGTMATQNKELFEEYLDEVYNPLEAIAESKDANSTDAKALLAAIMGLKMGYAPWKGIYLGAKSSGLLEEAIKANSESYIVQKMYAGSKFYTPEAFGGDVKAAAKAFEKCIALMEQKPELTKYNWIYLDALAHLGTCYAKLNRKEDAIAVYKKALLVEPEFYWVSKVLLPKVQ